MKLLVARRFYINIYVYLEEIGLVEEDNFWINQSRRIIWGKLMKLRFRLKCKFYWYLKKKFSSTRSVKLSITHLNMFLYMYMSIV